MNSEEAGLYVLEERNLPGIPLRRPAERHWMSRVGPRTLAKESNTVIESRVDVGADLEAINAGRALRQGQDFIVNGRTYRAKGDGSCFPVSGPGLHVLNRGAFKALGVYNEMGLEPAAEAQLDRMSIRSDARAAAREAYEAEHPDA